MEHVKVSLLDKNNEVQYGLNWGQREKRDPNQSYLQLTTEIYRGDFFPPKGKFFIVNTDDNKTLILTRAQKDLGCALQTPENNALLGSYIRSRLGVQSGQEITKQDILKNGISFFTFSKIDDMHYHLNFGEAKDINNTIGMNDNVPLQQIFYGAPGTGKSFLVDDKTDENNSVRTTFHPDSDYASFVGAYKPTMENVRINSIYGDSVQFATGKNGHPGSEKKIVYKYVPQAFLKAYVAAWSKLDTPYYLVIEEINRGNCAQIFGDLFQLLDRNSEGTSSYAIHADEDLAQFLSDDPKGFGNLSDEQKDAIRSFVLHKDNGKIQMVGPDILTGKLLLLPPNLRIWATMNTSDQSLFPIDSAFKRRWNWEYVPIEYDKKAWYIQVGDRYYGWGDFIAAINPIIYELTSSSDKQMGFFFVKPDKKSDEKIAENNVISEKLFINKVLFYLWTDVLKDYDVSEEPFLVKDSNPQRAYRFVDFFDKEHSYLQEFISKEKLGLKEVEIEVDVADMDGEQKVVNGVNARVDGTKCWTITQTMYYTLRAIAPETDYQQIKDLLKSHLNRDVDEVIKTITSAEGYTKENRWLDYNPLQSVDGQTFVITNQWKKDFIPAIKQLASDLGVEYIDYNEISGTQNQNGSSQGDANGSRTLDRYSVNGQGNFLMGPAATEAMKIYISNNPDRTAAEIVTDWSSFNRPKVYTKEQYEAKKALSKDSRIDKKHARFNLANGEAVYMSVGFIPESMTDFIRILDTKGWNIEIRKIN